MVSLHLVDHVAQTTAMLGRGGDDISRENVTLTLALRLGATLSERTHNTNFVHKYLTETGYSRQASLLVIELCAP